MAPAKFRCTELGGVIARSIQRSIASWDNLKEGLRLRDTDAEKEEIDVLMKKPD